MDAQMMRYTLQTVAGALSGVAVSRILGQLSYSLAAGPCGACGNEVKAGLIFGVTLPGSLLGGASGGGMAPRGSVAGAWIAGCLLSLLTGYAVLAEMVEGVGRRGAVQALIDGLIIITLYVSGYLSVQRSRSKLIADVT